MSNPDDLARARLIAQQLQWQVKRSGDVVIVKGTWEVGFSDTSTQTAAQRATQYLTGKHNQTLRKEQK